MCGGPLRCWLTPLVSHGSHMTQGRPPGSATNPPGCPLATAASAPSALLIRCRMPPGRSGGGWRWAAARRAPRHQPPGCSTRSGWHGSVRSERGRRQMCSAGSARHACVRLRHETFMAVPAGRSAVYACILLDSARLLHGAGSSAAHLHVALQASHSKHGGTKRRAAAVGPRIRHVGNLAPRIHLQGCVRGGV